MSKNIPSGNHPVLVESALLPLVICSHQDLRDRSLCYMLLI